MQYYLGTGPIGPARNVSQIIRAAVNGLLQDKRRIFSYTEQAYFQVRRQARQRANTPVLG